MGGETRSGRGHPVSGLEPLHPGPHFQNHARRTIPQRQRLIQPVHGLLEDADKPLFLSLSPDLPHQIRPGPGLPQQALLPHLDHQLLSPGADKRGHIPHQNAASFAECFRHFRQIDATIFITLDDLFHVCFQKLIILNTSWAHRNQIFDPPIIPIPITLIKRFQIKIATVDCHMVEIFLDSKDCTVYFSNSGVI